MSLPGSWSARLPRWFGTRPEPGPGRGAPPRTVRLRARAVKRDFVLWEAECVGCEDAGSSTLLTTVVGTRTVEIDLGRRPIEEIWAHLRRLRAAMDAMPADVSFVRFEGVVRAYDDYLWTACHELGVPTDLLTIGFGRQRDEERGRLERALGEVGLPVR